jgi:hypothetical protein
MTVFEYKMQDVTAKGLNKKKAKRVGYKVPRATCQTVVYGGGTADRRMLTLP